MSMMESQTFSESQIFLEITQINKFVVIAIETNSIFE